MFKAYYAYIADEEWGLLIHGETPGKAKARFKAVEPSGWCDFVDVRLRRVPGLDDRPITYENAAAAGFYYEDYEREPDEEGNRYLPKEDFSNDCNCSVCRGGKS